MHVHTGYYAFQRLTPSQPHMHSLFVGVNNAQIIKTAHLRADVALQVQVPAADLYSSCCSTHRLGQHTIHHITFNVVKYFKPKYLNKTQLKYCRKSYKKIQLCLMFIPFLVISF